MKKEKLLQALALHTFIHLRPSPVDGIGVFALTDIPCGTRGLFSRDTSEWLAISKEELSGLPETSRAMVENFCLYDESHYYVPEYGFNLIDPVIYLNHSDKPNVRSIAEGEDFEALCDIRAGEELFVDYGTLVEE